MSKTAIEPPRRVLRVPAGDELPATETTLQREPAYDRILAPRGDEFATSLPAPPASIDESAPGSSQPQRLFDFAAATLLLIACAPLLLLISVLSKLLQPGPLLYRQERIGWNGKPFHILKFRSMRVDAEKSTGPVFAAGNDPRCTRFGAWLRRSCCDELPQLINVLRGEMSLVGPRPERPIFVDEFRVNIPRYDERHSVRPGITGWAQVNGWRGDTRFEERLQFDLDYVRRSSLLFDLRILLRTPWAILRPRRIFLPDVAVVKFPLESQSPASGAEVMPGADATRFESVARRAA